MKIINTTLLIFVSAWFAGCASTAKVGSFEDKLSADYTPQKEEVWAHEQADKVHAEIVSKGLLYKDTQAEQLLSDIEQQLLGAERQHFDQAINIFLLRSPEANAMALPNGNIYVNTGLFTYLKSEQQLAAVIAHEVAHVTERHSVKSIISRKNTVVGAHIADLLTGGFGLAYFPALSSIMSYSRELETAADLVAVKELSGAGVSPESMAEVMEIFKTIPGNKNTSSAYQSHPTQDQRLTAINQYMSDHSLELNIESSNRIQSNIAFSDVKGKLMKVNVKMRLRSRHFNQALDIVDQAESFYGSAAVVSYYRGEAFNGLAKYPKDAGIEKYWIETGKVKKQKNPHITEFESQSTVNYAKAEQAYLAAANHEKPYIDAFKRLGQLYSERQENKQAVRWFMKYLEAKPDAYDKKRVNHFIQRLSKNKDAQ